jgi:hypothetical protein
LPGAEGRAKIFGVFRVKNHDFTPKKSYYSNFRGGARNFWDISCEKSRFYAKKIIFFSILGGGEGAPGAAPPWIRPCILSFVREITQITKCQKSIILESCRKWSIRTCIFVDDYIVCCLVVDLLSTITQLSHYKTY